ncbi:hypothetical protein Tco_0336947 [Tanacetum coccineum]
MEGMDHFWISGEAVLSSRFGDGSKDNSLHEGYVQTHQTYQHIPSVGLQTSPLVNLSSAFFREVLITSRQLERFLLSALTVVSSLHLLCYVDFQQWDPSVSSRAMICSV